MTDHRPLENVPTRALYALHRGIEGRDRLIIGVVAKSCDTGVEVCAIGATLTATEQTDYAVGRNIDSIRDAFFARWNKLGATELDDSIVAVLNNCFRGTPEQRREFMLRHILSELRSRGKKLGGNSPRQPQKEEVKV